MRPTGREPDLRGTVLGWPATLQPLELAKQEKRRSSEYRERKQALHRRRRKRPEAAR